MSVGSSPGRTPIKHFLLDSLLGRVNGSLTTGKAAAVKPLLCVDLCAGDGIKSESHTASPLIFEKHCRHPCGRENNASLVLIERDRANFDLLRQNVGDHEWMTLSNSDARNFLLPPLNPMQAVFVHCDPNNVHQTPLTKEFVSTFTKCTMYLVTLGCNADGIKRLPLDQRQGWHDYVAMLTDVLPPWHDAILFWLVKDSAQWAYLCNVPAKWKDQTIELATSSRVAKSWKKGVGGISLRSNRRRFAEELNRLFLTKEEMDGQMRLFK